MKAGKKGNCTIVIHISLIFVTKYPVYKRFRNQYSAQGAPTILFFQHLHSLIIFDQYLLTNCKILPYISSGIAILLLILNIEIRISTCACLDMSQAPCYCSQCTCRQYSTLQYIIHLLINHQDKLVIHTGFFMTQEKKKIQMISVPFSLKGEMCHGRTIILHCHFGD